MDGMFDKINRKLKTVEMTIKELIEDWDDLDQIDFSVYWTGDIHDFRTMLTDCYENGKMNELQKQRYLAIKDYLEQNQTMLEVRNLFNLKTKIPTKEDIRRIKKL